VLLRHSAGHQCGEFPAILAMGKDARIGENGIKLCCYRYKTFACYLYISLVYYSIKIYLQIL
jgi:hypothetical protein